MKRQIFQISVVLLSIAVGFLCGCKEETKEDPAYTVTVTGGTASPTSGKTGTVVTLTVGTPEEGKVFKEWNVVSGGVTITDNTFTIGTANVVIEAVWEDLPAGAYTVTVTGGTASPTFGTAGTVVTLTVGTPPEGKVFKEWNVVSGGVTITDNSFTIGEANVVIEAVWEDVPIYTVTVTRGAAYPTSGTTGTVVTLTANTPEEGKLFKEWNVVSGGVTITDNTFTIGEANVVIEAVWGSVQKMDRTDWSSPGFEESNDGTIGYSSQQFTGDKTIVTNMWDGNNASFWHSEWSPVVRTYPHWFIIDLGEEVSVAKISMVIRDAYRAGPTGFELLTCSVAGAVNLEDPETWAWESHGEFDLDQSAEFPNDTEQEYPLGDFPTARYIKVYMDAKFQGTVPGSGAPVTSAMLAEIYVYILVDEDE